MFRQSERTSPELSFMQEERKVHVSNLKDMKIVRSFHKHCKHCNPRKKHWITETVGEKLLRVVWRLTDVLSSILVEMP